MKRACLYIVPLMALLLTARLLSGCVEEYHANVGKFGEGCLVVEGTIVSDSTVTFYLSRSFSLEDEEGMEDYRDVQAELRVKGSDNSCWNATPLGRGAYEVPIGTLQRDAQYYVEIVYNGDTYTSFPQYPLESTPIDFTYAQQGERGNVDLSFSAKSDGSQVEYYHWHFEEDWELRTQYACNHVMAYLPSSNGTTLSLQVQIFDEPPYSQGWYHYSQQEIYIGKTEDYEGNVMHNKLLKSYPSDVRALDVCYSMLLRQRNVTKTEYEFYRSRQKMNNEMGGLFTPQPSELPCNLTCDNPDKEVLGYVGCNLTVNHQRLFIYRGDVYSTFSMEETCETLRNEADMMLLLPGGKPTWYSHDYQICTYDEPASKYQPYVYYWAPKECVDVRGEGVSLEKPAFWPELDY